MVAKGDRVEKSKPGSGNKVSKPVMEKKRRARINKCLEHLKSLLEGYYSTSIRKRKLEKADILELTVNHLRNLQKLHSCAAAAASDLSRYHSGFRRCLANVDQYLLTSDHVTGSDRWMLSQLSASLCCSRGPEDAFSTADSGPGDAGTRDAVQSTTSSLPTEAARQEAARQAPGDRRVLVAAPAENTHEDSSRNKKLQSVGHRDVVANATHSVWRPW